MHVEPGIYLDGEVTDDVYFSLPYASKSQLWDVHRMPETVRTLEDARAYMAREKDSYALTLGRAFDDAVIDPDGWREKYDTGPTKTPTAKAFIAAQEASDKPLLVETDFDLVDNMVKSMYAHDLAGDILRYDKRRFQVVVVWDDPATGIRCKGKIDMWSAYMGRSVHVDFKTFSVKRPGLPFARAFGFESADYGYDVQAAHYLDGCGVIRPGHRRDFLIIAVNKKPEDWKPDMHAVHVARYPDHDIDAALRVRDELLCQWQSIKDGTWTPNPSRVHELQTNRDTENHHANTPETPEGAF